MTWGKRKRRTREYFKILVLDEGAGFTDEEVKKGLRRMFYGSKDFQQHMYKTYCAPV